MKDPSILIVEDDYQQAGEISDMLVEQYTGVNLIDVGSEKQFREFFSELRHSPPALVIMDVVQKWAEPSDRSQPPDEIGALGPYRAGIRCTKRLLDDPTLKSTPVILYSELDRKALRDDLDGFPPNVFHLKKEGTNVSLARLIRTLLVGGKGLPNERKAKAWRKIWSKVSFSFSIGIVSVNFGK